MTPTPELEAAVERLKRIAERCDLASRHFALGQINTPTQTAADLRLVLAPLPTGTGEGEACTCGRPRTWPWIFCGSYLCNGTPFTTAQRRAAYARRDRRTPPTQDIGGDQDRSERLEEAAKALFRRAQGVYREDHDHFPLSNEWDGVSERIRDGWRSMVSVVETALASPSSTRSVK